MLSPSSSLLRKSAVGPWSQRWLWGQSQPFSGFFFHPFYRFRDSYSPFCGGEGPPTLQVLGVVLQP